MNNQEFQLILMNITLILVAVLLLLFILRGIKVLIYKKIESKEDSYFVLFCFFIMLIVAYCAYKIKSVFKKSKEPIT